MRVGISLKATKNIFNAKVDILIPLGSCDASILEGAAKKYQEITDIPVKIRRIKEVLPLSETYRIPYQRLIQETLVEMNGKDINFADWNKDRYIQELKKGAESKDALTKYYVKDLITKIDNQSGQYRAGPYVDLFSRTIEKYRSNDDRTMYVGVTGINIYSGDNNFVFSLHVARKESQASVLSYYMMTSANLSAEYESRNRLVERIAKELVPASLKSLGIPRSTDPTCPYSYSSGVERLDQKTLTLSEPVKSAIKNIKLQQRN
jgi:predicted Zn-dependent protease